MLERRFFGAESRTQVFVEPVDRALPGESSGVASQLKPCTAPA
jgi:hypothetical protein